MGENLTAVEHLPSQTTEQEATEREATVENTTEADATLLRWRVHLLRRHPERLPALVAVLVIGGGCVWLLFARPLPVLAALLLLLGSAADYLLPTTYRITTRGIEARSPVAHLILTRAEARRCLPDPAGLIVTSLAIPSRLDRFRGVLLRYAPPGEPGDRATVQAAIARCAPKLTALSLNAEAPAPPVDARQTETTLPGACPDARL